MEKTYVIRNKFSGRIIFSLKCKSFQLCVEAAISWGIKLHDASFYRASFKDASLDGASFKDASFNDASFDGASFNDASFDGASFNDASFNDASFNDASFNDASFDGASFNDASFDGASFKDASFDGVKGLIVIQWMDFTMMIQAKKTKIGCQFRDNDEWLSMDIDRAVELGIDRNHFESYRALFKASIETLMD